MSGTPHDALFKAIFSQPALAMDEVRAVLPPELTRHLDAASAQLCAGSFVDEELKERHADLLFRVAVAGQDAFVYLLLEHQSEPDALMPYRLLRYLVRVWERWLAEHPGATTLPAIVPLVLTHASRGWTAPRTMHELYGLDPAVLRDFSRWLPALEFALDDLSTRSDEELRARVMGA